MAQHSGRRGALSGIGSVRSWSIEDAQELSKQVASNTGTGTNSTPGVCDWTGNFQAYGHQPPLMPGDPAVFLGYTAPDNDSTGVGLTYGGNILISQVALTWNWTAGEVLSMAIDFGGHLALTNTAADAQITDASPLDAPLVALTKIQYSTDGVSWTTWGSLSQATLTITNSLQTYVDSDTVISNVIWTGRKAGITNWTLAIVEHNTDRARFFKGQQLWLRLYVTPVQFWELKWGEVKNFSGLQVNIETGAILQQTVNVEMQSNDDGIVSGTRGVLGHILKPDGTRWFGVA